VGDSLKVNMLMMSKAVLAADGPTSVFDDIGYLYQQGKKTAAHMKLKLAVRAESKELDNAIEAFKINPDAYDNLKRISTALGKYKRGALKFFEEQRRSQRRAEQTKRMKSGRPTTLWKENSEAKMPFQVDLASERATMAKVAAALAEVEKKLTAVDLKTLKAALARVVALPHPKLAATKDPAVRHRLSEENKITVSQTNDEDEAGPFKVFRLTWGNLRTDQEKALKAALMDLGLEVVGIDIDGGRHNWKTIVEVVEAGRVPQQREAHRWWQNDAK
jgi:hypothetical protein